MSARFWARRRLETAELLCRDGYIDAATFRALLDTPDFASVSAGQYSTTHCLHCGRYCGADMCEDCVRAYANVGAAVAPPPVVTAAPGYNVRITGIDVEPAPELSKRACKPGCGAVGKYWDTAEGIACRLCGRLVK
jgi:hypothetical protein